ncbi:MAG TPA: VIT and VWA domain-containing protein, partial [Blastocatellia bacterium]
MFNPKTFANSRPDGIAALEIVGEDDRPPGQPRMFVPLKRTELSGEVIGPLASLRLTQIYGYSKEQLDKTLEAVYRFPLPGDAAVTGVRVSFGEVEINAELKERGHAEADYEEAVRTGRQAALATRESPDVFTLRVAGVRPDQEIKVETRYAQLARAEGGGWSLRIPLTTASRYVRGDELTSRHAQGQPLALLRDPGHRFALDIVLRGASAVESSTHQLATAEEGGAVRARLRDGETIPDRDCVLVWRPREEARAAALQVFLADDPESGQAYFLALVSPPSEREPARSAPREAILLVDHSGSMSGAKWEAADWAVKSFLYGLSERDTFALGLFHNATNWFDKKPRRADGAAVEKAINFLERNRDSGGTELGVALEQALGLARSTDGRARHTLIITDAEVSDAGRILRLADEESRRDDRRRISVLCIDAAPNSHLAMELAERGGGVAKFLTSNPEEEDITTALDEALADWAEPALTGLRLEINSPVAQAAGREVR